MAGRSLWKDWVPWGSQRPSRPAGLGERRSPAEPRPPQSELPVLSFPTPPCPPVIDGLDLLKKEHPGARDGIRYLEAEFKKGNRYIRCQKEVGKSFERHKLKRQDADAWALYKILDSCKQLTLAQGAGEEDPSGMVTIVTGLPLDNPSALSGPMQAALQAAAHASVDIKNVLDFYKQWKEIG